MPINDTTKYKMISRKDLDFHINRCKRSLVVEAYTPKRKTTYFLVERIGHGEKKVLGRVSVKIFLWHDLMPVPQSFQSSSPKNCYYKFCVDDYCAIRLDGTDTIIQVPEGSSEEERWEALKIAGFSWTTIYDVGDVKDGEFVKRWNSLDMMKQNGYICTENTT